MHTEREVTEGCPQDSCCGPAFWNIQYNSLLNLEFGKRTKAIAYADDLLIAVKAETVRGAENCTNIEISKITKWAKDNKIAFNEQKSKAMVVTRKKRREKKDCTSLNHLKPTGHVMHQQFNIQQLYSLPTLYLCVLYLSENKQRLVPLTA